MEKKYIEFVAIWCLLNPHAADTTECYDSDDSASNGSGTMYYRSAAACMPLHYIQGLTKNNVGPGVEQ